MGIPNRCRPGLGVALTIGISLGIYAAGLRAEDRPAADLVFLRGAVITMDPAPTSRTRTRLPSPWPASRPRPRWGPGERSAGTSAVHATARSSRAHALARFLGGLPTQPREAFRDLLRRQYARHAAAGYTTIVNATPVARLARRRAR